MIDTASSDTWIASPNVQCLTQDRQSPLPQSDCGFQDFYSPGKEFKPIPNQTFDIFYGSGGFARGDFGRVDVEVAGIKLVLLSVCREIADVLGSILRSQ